jgi:hypothetical protein
VIVHEEAVQSERVLQLVASSRCSADDCEFVAAAQQLGVPLITADRALLEAFPGIAQPQPFCMAELYWVDDSLVSMPRYRTTGPRVGGASVPGF